MLQIKHILFIGIYNRVINEFTDKFILKISINLPVIFHVFLVALLLTAIGGYDKHVVLMEGADNMRHDVMTSLSTGST